MHAITLPHDDWGVFPNITVHCAQNMMDTTESELPSCSDDSDAQQSPHVHEVLSLKNFVAKYHMSFPLRMRIEDGEYSNDPEESLSAGDVYWLHLVKGTASVLIKGTAETGYKDITVPANSSVEYGLVYSHAVDAENELSLNCFVAKTAGDIMSLRPMPRVVCATRSHRTGKDYSSVSSSEILVIQEVRRVRVFGQRLKVYSITEGIAKVLSTDCSGYFSTQPALTKLNMHTLLKHVKFDFPTQAYVYSGGTDDVHIPRCLHHCVVTLQAIVEGSQSVLATNYLAGCKPAFIRPSSDYLHLPLDSPIVVSLYDKAAASVAVTATESDDEDCTTITNAHTKWKLRSHDTKPQISNKVEEEPNDEGGNCDVYTTQSLMSLQEDLELKFNLSINKVAAAENKSDSSYGYACLNIVAQHQSASASHYDAPSRTKFTDNEEKKVALNGLTVNQVCELLVTLGMAQYQETFQKENINGDVLLFCTEDVLRDELRIDAPEEREKLLQIIRENEESYSFKN